MMKPSIYLLLLSLVGIQATAVAQELSQATPPNIVLILVDDAGLMDFGSFGGEALTPHIDSLARSGIMFTNMHASPVCAPSRAMLMTGSDSHLTGVPNLPEMLPEEYQDFKGYEGVLNGNVQTIATRLQAQNYRTYVTGKWHLGCDEYTLPNARGFDRSFILSGSGASNYEQVVYLPFKSKAQWFEDGVETDLPEDFYSSEHYVDQMIRFHEEENDAARPFFSFISFQAIHAPIQAPREMSEKYQSVYEAGWEVMREQRYERSQALGLIPEGTEMNPVPTGFRSWAELPKAKQEEYITDMSVTAAMLEAMDSHIGRYIAYLTEEGLMENTIFIVTSDNGPDGGDYESLQGWAKRQGYHRELEEQGGDQYYGFLGAEFASAMAAPFSTCKYYTGEGGLRVPLIISGRGLPTGQMDHTFCFFTDIAPTIYELAGLAPVANEGYAPITGKSMLPHIQDPEIPVYEDHEGIGLEAAGCAAYFLGGYKILRNNGTLGDHQWHMYNLRTDPTETTDIAREEPLRFQHMLSLYEQYAKEVGVLEMPEEYSAQGEVAKKSMKAVLNPFK